MRIVVRAALGLLLLAGGYLVWAYQQPPVERFCTMGLAIVEVGGEEFVTQDQAPPGPDGCDLVDQAEYGTTPVLSRECTVRGPDGDERVIAKPNRADGTCGIPDGHGAPEPI